MPVYSGLDATRRCLKSVLASRQITLFELVIVFDQGPDPQMATYLEDLSADGFITLIINEANIGYVDSANLGMMLHTERDVVLLNSDTEVANDWLDRLRRAAHSSPDIATVTPFSNNATLASYPRYMKTNQLPEELDTATADNIFKEVNHGRYIDIPTAVGFCAYISRWALNRVGYFDSLHFGRGYGEENDFSMRAQAAGFRHLLAGDTFVFHQGGTSFGAQADSLSEAAQGFLKQLHPAYELMVQRHCSRDPERPLRRRVDMTRLASSPRRRLLFISHRLGGGTEKHIQDLARLLEPEFEVLILRPSGVDEVSIEWARPGEDFNVYFQLPGGYDRLVDFLKSLGICRIHIHHTVELKSDILDLHNELALDVPFDVTIHDYYFLCPFTNLMTETGDYCGEPSLAVCDLCFATRRPMGEISARQRRVQAQELLAAADRVIVPSRDTLDRMKSYFPEINLVLLPHPEDDVEPRRLEAPAASAEMKVLVLGELSLAKGLRLLEACAADVSRRNLPLIFRVLGRPLARVRQEPELPLSFSGPYSNGQLMELISNERPDVIFFPARWPETYSYTLSAALRTGLPIVAPRLGVFPERLEAYPAAYILNWDTESEEWNDLFLSIKSEPVVNNHGL